MNWRCRRKKGPPGATARLVWGEVGLASLHRHTHDPTPGWFRATSHPLCTQSRPAAATHPPHGSGSPTRSSAWWASWRRPQVGLQPRLCTCQCAAPSAQQPRGPRRPPRAAQPRARPPHSSSSRKRRRRWRRPQSWVSSPRSRGGGGSARGGARGPAPGEGCPGRALIRSRDSGEQGGRRAGRGPKAPPPPHPSSDRTIPEGAGCQLSVSFSPCRRSAPWLQLISSF